MSRSSPCWLPLLLFGLCCVSAQAQQQGAGKVPQPVPVPSLHPRGPVVDPATPEPRDIQDPLDRLAFHLPSGWNLSLADGEVSTFHLDAPTAPRRAQLRMVASLGFNPYPQSTFEGALFYISSTPHATAATCAMQTAQKPLTPLAPVRVDDVPFTRGREERGHICTEERDVAYTALRRGSCLRFDLAIHNFCGGEVSGAQDLGETELSALFSRLQGILDSVHFQTAP